MNRVPHCSDCEHCEKVHVLYPYFYCKKQKRNICVDKLIKTSPKWCPKRETKE